MKNIFTLLLLLIGTTSLMAGPWPKPKGQAYLKLYEFWLQFDEHYTSNGEIDPNATLGLYNTAIYGEYGITDRLTVFGNVPFFSRNVINTQVSGTRGDVLIPGEAINGLGDADLGLRFGLTNSGSPIALAASLTLGLPLGESAGGEQKNLQTGDGEFNQMLLLEAGKSFRFGDDTDGYLSAFAGINNRSNGFSDEFRFGLEGGVNLLNRKVWLIGRLAGSESFFNGETAETVSSTSIFSNNAEYLSLGGEVNVYLTRKLGVSAGVAGALSGRIIAAAPAFSAGVFLDLQ